MTLFSWLSEEKALTSAALTVRAQARNPTDLGRMYHPVFFPRRDVDSVKIAEISTNDFRPVADRREWNARGRHIGLKTPPMRDLEMIPIESYFNLGEREIQALTERTLGNEALFRQIVGADLPSRVLSLADANLRRIEVDALRAWALGSILVRNPQGSATDQVVSLGFAGARYVTAAPAWTGTDTGTAYAKFVEGGETAQSLIGSLGGAVMRQSTYNAIRDSAPKNSFEPRPTRSAVQARLQDEFQSEFRLLIIEDTHDIFDAGGAATTRTKVWPAGRVAYLPADLSIGNTLYAPVARAFELARVAPEARIDVRGQAVYRETSGNGRHLDVECQVNALPLPDEQRVFVIDAGI